MHSRPCQNHTRICIYLPRIGKKEKKRKICIDRPIPSEGKNRKKKREKESNMLFMIKAVINLDVWRITFLLVDHRTSSNKK